MEILWWLAPAALVAVAAMIWVSWVAREGHGEVSREVAVERLEAALRKEHPAMSAPRPSRARARDRSTGIAVRPSRSTGQSRRSA